MDAVLTLKKPKIVISNKLPFKSCCEKWERAMAVPLHAWDDSPFTACTERDTVNFCPVCGTRFRIPFKLPPRSPDGR